MMDLITSQNQEHKEYKFGIMEIMISSEGIPHLLCNR